MKKVKKIESLLVMLFFAMILQSCHTENNVNDVISGYTQEPLPNGQGVNIQLEQLAQLGCVHGATLMSPQQVEIQDTIVIIRDEKGVFAFNKNGRFIRQYGKRGRGKGEYVNLSAFYIEKDGGVAIVDAFRKRILHYDKFGTFLTEEKTGEHVLDYVCSMLPVTGSDERLCTYMINPEDDEMYSLIDANLNRLSVCKTGLTTKGSAEMFGWHPVSKYEDKIRYVMPYENKIFTYSTEDVTEISIGMQEKASPETSDFTLMGMLNQLLQGKFIGFTDIFETNNYILLGVSNFSYVLVDKSSLTCKHYSYAVPELVESLPLLNIVAASGDRMYGLITPMKVMIDSDVKSRNRDFDRIMLSAKDMELTDNPILVTYRIDKNQ